MSAERPLIVYTASCGFNGADGKPGPNGGDGSDLEKKDWGGGTAKAGNGTAGADGGSGGNGGDGPALTIYFPKHFQLLHLH